MFYKGSRYLGGKEFSGRGKERPVFPGIRPREIGRATGMLEHVIKEDERLDELSHHYYNDPHKWWRILDANTDVLFGPDLFLKHTIGTTIVIPQMKETE